MVIRTSEFFLVSSLFIGKFEQTWAENDLEYIPPITPKETSNICFTKWWWIQRMYIISVEDCRNLVLQLNI